ncbi:hypothetical protein GNI_071190 [Gregarina niphandrodes]|uniref:Transmembrane protein n=1 Tax=Gregarina niphandrodes TaxID=110365 RepID=A0A023B7B0_GRENI|nr:hypothetical protein GNI_071190 [Gregarina niphandrodes]EZG67155.1 hypothetical protein GNI_071190 [Gregarina niphandrodes]|eukprot:XP_011130324.1 hypothetical protein GNI_071190 [Gregarina niphandrodes]
MIVMSLLLAVLAGGWSLTDMKAECRESYECCLSNACRPLAIAGNPLGCMEQTDWSCRFRTFGYGQAYMEEIYTGKPLNGCSSDDAGQVIVSMPDEFFNGRFVWQHGNLTVGPLSAAGVEPCYATDWFVQFATWPVTSCVQRVDQLYYKANDYVRLNAYDPFNSPSSDQATLVTGAYLTLDLAPFTNRGNDSGALAIVAGNQDCRLRPVILTDTSARIGGYRITGGGKSYQRRLLTVWLNGHARGLLGEPELVTPPADLTAPARAVAFKEDPNQVQAEALQGIRSTKPLLRRTPLLQRLGTMLEPTSSQPTSSQPTSSQPPSTQSSRPDDWTASQALTAQPL